MRPDLDRLALLEGLISHQVGLRLAALAASVPREQAIVEIGSYKGKSTAYLAMGASSGRGAIVHAVDPWDTPGNIGGRFGFDQKSVREDFERQLTEAGVREQVVAIRNFSTRAAREWQLAIGLLYIDGSHTEKDVRADWLAWSPHLAPGAVVAFDDYDTPRNPGVKVVVDEIGKRFGREWAFIPTPLAIGWAA